MFTCQGQVFANVAIARRVVVGGWEYVPAAVDGQGGCNWMVEERYLDPDDLPAVAIVDCGAEAAFNGDRFECAAGHAHVSAEARDREGWDYAHDATEAALLAKVGIGALDMQGHVFV